MSNEIAFEPAEIGGVDDPYPAMHRLRAAAPVHRTASGLVCVSTYALVNGVLRDDRFRSGPLAELYRLVLPPSAARDEMGHRINFLDPPDHPRVRGLVGKAFTPRRIAALRPWVEARAAELVQRLPAAGEIDLLAELAHPLPSLVISELLGVPIADRDTLTRWTEATTPLLGVGLSAGDRARALDAADRFRDYMSALVEDRRAHPGDDLLSALIAAEEEGDRLTMPELLSLAVTLYSAGHRTTRDLFSNGVLALVRHPAELARVQADHALVPATVLEMLRYDTPTLFVSRFPTVAVELDGVAVAAEEPLLLLLGAANRDPAQFPDPDRFDAGRDNGPPLSFAAGAHFCLGAPLARMEAEVMLHAVLDRWAHLDLAAPPAWKQGTTFRGLQELRVEVG